MIKILMILIFLSGCAPAQYHCEPEIRLEKTCFNYPNGESKYVKDSNCLDMPVETSKMDCYPMIGD